MHIKLNKTMDSVEKYPYPIAGLKKDHPRTSFPVPLTADVLADYQVAEVKPASKPSAAWDEIVVDVTGDVAPQFENGQVLQLWQVQPAPDLAAAKEKERRRIKQRAYDDIVAQYPEWKQRNLIADALEELVAQLKANNVPVDETAVQAAVDAWTFVKQRRAQSDNEEAALDQ